MKKDMRKVVLVGTGMVGMSYAYALLNRNACDELVLIDIDRRRAEGEAMDLNHGLAFSGSHMKIYAASYEACRDADLVVIAAGVAQKAGETRPALLQRNTAVFRTVVESVMTAGFHGLFLVASNPVDVMTRVTQAVSGLPPYRVLGSGTTLDTARLRYLLGRYFAVDPRNVHAYVMGEHGDSEFVPWSQALVATRPVREICAAESGGAFMRDMEALQQEVRGAAQQIIAAKGATYYGIGMALLRITRAIFGDEHSVLTVSAWLSGEYGQRDVYVGVPCVVGRAGVERVLTLSLHAEEQAQLAHSCTLLRRYWQECGMAPCGG